MYGSDEMCFQGMLKDKNVEMNHLKARVKQLQDSHVKFRGQIQALESVKDLSVSLRLQVNKLEEENKNLVVENAKLSAVNNQAEEILIEEEASIKTLADKLQASEIETAEAKGRIEQLVANKSELETLASEEQSARLSAEARIRSMDALIDSLTTENKELKYKLDVANKKVEQCDKEISMAASQLATLSEEVANIQQMRDSVRHAETEKEVMQTDVRRLLRLLENYPAATGFLKQWQDSEGMSFVDSQEPKFIQKPKKMSNQNSSPTKYDPDHLSQSDFIHLQRVYEVDYDTTPMLSTMEEEMEHWVPQESILEGYKFLTSKLPHTSADVIQKFLKRMNRIWLRREKRRVSRVKEKYSNTIANLKRQLSMAKPYHGVMAERKIRCLSGQVRNIQEKKLKGRPKLWNEYEEEDNYFDVGDDPQPIEVRGRGRGDASANGRRSSSLGARRGGEPREQWNKYHANAETLAKPLKCARAVSPCTREFCASRQLPDMDETVAHTVHATTASKALQELDSISTKELLGASLQSLDHIHRRVALNNSVHDPNSSLYEGVLDASNFDHPNSDYLEGALWLGRNMLMTMEELVGEVDNYRTKYLREVSSLNKEAGKSDATGHNLSTFADRFALLAVSGVTEAMSIMYQARKKSRNLLEVYRICLKSSHLQILLCNMLHI